MALPACRGARRNARAGGCRCRGSDVIRSLDAEPGRRPVMRRGTSERGRRSGPGKQPGRHDGLIARGAGRQLRRPVRYRLVKDRKEGRSAQSNGPTGSVRFRTRRTRRTAGGPGNSPNLIPAQTGASRRRDLRPIGRPPGHHGAGGSPPPRRREHQMKFSSPRNRTLSPGRARNDATSTKRERR